MVIVHQLRVERQTPRDNGRCAYRTGRYTAKAKAEKQETRALLMELRSLIAFADE